MTKSSPLTAGLVQKGHALPSTQPAAKPTAPATSYYKSLTVKLDRTRYETLKNAGLKLDKKSQEIFVEALDAYLSKSTITS